MSINNCCRTKNSYSTGRNDGFYSFGRRNYNVKYKWTVDKGTIINGQETTAIQVSNEGLEDTVIRAMLEVEGLPKDCNNNISDEGVIAARLPIEPFDQYGKISWEDELMRFDSFLIYLDNNPKSKGYVCITTEKKESILSLKKHIRKLVKHIKFRKILLDKIIFATEKSDHHRTTIITIPEGAEILKCENCEILKGSEFK